MTKPKTWQKPKPDHPWRQYSNTKTTTKEEPRNDIIPVKQWLEELLDVWDKKDIDLDKEYERSQTHKIATLPQAKQAAWIAGMLKKYYVNKRTH